MYFLGIYNGHNATAALLKGGEVLASVSEERFKRKKNYGGFPEESIKWLLKEFGVKSEDIGGAALPYNYGVPIFASQKTQENVLVKSLKWFYLVVGFVRRGWGPLVYRFPILRLVNRFVYLFFVRMVGKPTVDKEKQFLADFLGVKKELVGSFDHHLCHAVAAYFSSPFNSEKALVLTLDGEGDTLCATVSVAQGKKIKCLAKTSNEDSLGLVYMHLTRYLGMKPLEHEYKVMGLAPYAKEYGVEKVYQKIKDLVILNSRNPLIFEAKFDTHETYRYLRKEMEGERFDNIAGAFQRLVEERVVEWVREAIVETEIKTVVCGGGVFMNVKVNQRIAQIPEVEKLYVMPSCGDDSTPIGAAYLSYLGFCEKSRVEAKMIPIKALYWGPKFSNETIEKFLTDNRYDKKYKVEKVENIEKRIAELLADKKIVACLSGRMEWGARALGNRSILANPSTYETVRIINEQIKGRDFWMPFTPSILAERADDYLINPKKIPVPYMILTLDSTELAREHLSAAMHPYDFTIRPQVVEKDWNPRYHKIIKEFEKLTGIGGVLNTSFNLHGLPIVLGPREAMYAFENSGLEYLVLEDYLIGKNL